MGLFKALTSTVKAVANTALIPLDVTKDVVTNNIYSDKKSDTRKRAEAIAANVRKVNRELQD